MKLTHEQIKAVAMLGGWKYWDPAQPLPISKDSDAKHLLTYCWETPEGLGSVDGPDLNDLNVMVDIIARWCEKSDDNTFSLIIKQRVRSVLAVGGETQSVHVVAPYEGLPSITDHLVQVMLGHAGYGGLSDLVEAE